MIHAVLMTALCLLMIGVIGGGGVWFLVWMLKKVFHLDDNE